MILKQQQPIVRRPIVATAVGQIKKIYFNCYLLLTERERKKKEPTANSFFFVAYFFRILHLRKRCLKF